MEVVDKEVRLSEDEFDHMEKCIECQTAFAKSILQVARTRARNKVRKPSQPV